MDVEQLHKKLLEAHDHLGMMVKERAVHLAAMRNSIKL